MNYKLAMTVMLFTAGLAHAQLPPQQPQATRPAYSPYLNLLRNNVPAYQNYYGLVQPQIQAQSQINNLQQQVTGLQNASQAATFGGTGSELSTGKQVSFFTHRGWFLNSGGYGSSRGITGSYSNAGQNSVSQPQAYANPNLPSGNIMPYRR